MTKNTGTINLGTKSATGRTATTNLGPLGLAPHRHTVQLVVTGSPTTCSVQLEGTLDPANPVWGVLSASIDATTQTTFHVADRPVRAVCLNVTALSGGSSPSVTAKYLGAE